MSLVMPCLARCVPRRGQWMASSGALAIRSMATHDYEHWTSTACSEEVESQIEKDVTRSGVPAMSIDALRRVLRAHSCRNAAIGYTQGLNYIAAMLLSQGVPACGPATAHAEAEAFWLLCVITEQLLPDYFVSSLAGVRTDQAVLNVLLHEHPDLADLPAHFEAVGFDLLLVTPQWLMLAYADTLPRDTLLHVWDLFFAEGARVLLATAIAILRYQADALRACDDLEGVYSLLRTDGAQRRIDADRLMLFVRLEMAGLTADRLHVRREEHRRTQLAAAAALKGPSTVDPSRLLSVITTGTMGVVSAVSSTTVEPVRCEATDSHAGTPRARLRRGCIGGPLAPVDARRWRLAVRTRR